MQRICPGRAVPCLLFLLLVFAAAAPAAPLRVNGSTTVNLPVAEAAELLRREKGLDIQIDTHGGSAGGIAAVGDGLVHVGMLSKPLTADDRARYPKVGFVTTRIGEDAVALVVSADVWAAGVRSLSKEEARAIYESRITNWKELGGPDRRIAFFNKEPGRGTWEVFVTWIYGEAKQAPRASFLEVGGNEETRNKVGSTRGALSQLSVSWVDGRKVFALGVRTPDGRVAEPTSAAIAAGQYPLSRPLLLLTNGVPVAESKMLIDELLGARGQDLVRKHGYLPLAGAGR